MNNQASKNPKLTRITNQRLIISDYLKSVKSHPTAETVYTAVKKKLPQISYGTVYRNLKRLKENGEIRELDFGAKASRFDGNPTPHFHFHCRSCGEVLNIFPTKITKCVLCLEKFSPGKIENFRVEAYGICQDCQNLKSLISKRRKDEL